MDPLLVAHFESGRTVVDAVRAASAHAPTMRLEVEKAVLDLLVDRDR